MSNQAPELPGNAPLFFLRCRIRQRQHQTSYWPFQALRSPPIKKAPVKLPVPSLRRAAAVCASSEDAYLQGISTRFNIQPKIKSSLASLASASSR